MNIERAQATPGWMSDAELTYLAECAGKSTAIVEIGSWKGRSTLALACNTPGTVYAVDTWKGTEQQGDELAQHEPGWLLTEFKRNTAGLDNIVICEGPSVEMAKLHMGLTLDMIFIDGDALPTINGTGTEDYYNGAWDFGGQPFGYLHNGAPHIVAPERLGGRYCLYRWHIESPITFEKSIRVTMEHGHANHRSDDFFTTAFWYQTEPHAAFPALPTPNQRIARIFAVGGPGPVPPPKE